MDCIYNIVGFSICKWREVVSGQIDSPRNEPESREARKEMCSKRIIFWEIVA